MFHRKEYEYEWIINQINMRKPLLFASTLFLVLDTLMIALQIKHLSKLWLNIVRCITLLVNCSMLYCLYN